MLGAYRNMDYLIHALKQCDRDILKWISNEKIRYPSIYLIPKSWGTLRHHRTY